MEKQEQKKLEDMEDFEKFNLTCEAQGDFAKEICEWIEEMRTRYAGITDSEKMILDIIQGHLSRVAKMYAKKEVENENN